MMNLVPLQAVPAQNVKTVLADQIVEINLRQLRYGLFIAITVNGSIEIGGVICENLNRIIRSAYLNTEAGFSGDFVFRDTQGNSDPYFTGLGSRFQLLYLSQSDLSGLGLTG